MTVSRKAYPEPQNSRTRYNSWRRYGPRGALRHGKFTDNNAQTSTKVNGMYVLRTVDPATETWVHYYLGCRCKSIDFLQESLGLIEVAAKVPGVVRCKQTFFFPRHPINGLPKRRNEPTTKNNEETDWFFLVTKKQVILCSSMISFCRWSDPLHPTASLRLIHIRVCQ